MTHYSRSDWRARPGRTIAGGQLERNAVQGIALHWPAMAKPIRGKAAVAAALRGWQSYHMDGHGWADIAYQVAVDQDGNRWELRGLRTQSAANGNQDVNGRFGAVLLILAPGERPTPAMIAETQRVVADHRHLFPRSSRIVGHRDIAPEGTSCPGPVVEQLLRQGAFTPSRGRTQGANIDAGVAAFRKALRENTDPTRRGKIRAVLAAAAKLRSWPRRG